MQNLSILTDEVLLKETDRLVREERELLTVILHHLCEVERRRLYCGYSSLFAYAVGRLGYSEDQAYRRISAMRLVREMPQVEKEIENGDLNLSHISVAQNLFSSEKKQGREFTAEKKAEVLESISGLSVREAQKVAATYAPEAPVQPDVVKPIAPGRNLARVELSDETLAKIEKLKGLLAHEQADMPLDELVNRLCDLGLEQWDPAREPKRAVKKDSKAAISRAVWARDGSCCTVCASTYKVQEDHRLPESMGGEYTLENIRLLCQSCNQRAAIEKLGLGKMDPYLSPWTSKVETHSEVKGRVLRYSA